MVHDNIARRIAKRGRDFIWQNVRQEDVECYWKKLLLEYASLLAYKPTRDSELIERTERDQPKSPRKPKN